MCVAAWSLGVCHADHSRTAPAEQRVRVLHVLAECLRGQDAERPRRAHITNVAAIAAPAPHAGIERGLGAHWPSSPVSGGGALREVGSIAATGRSAL